MSATSSPSEMPEDLKAVLDEAYNNVREEDARYRRHIERAKHIALSGLELAVGGVCLKLTGLLSNAADMAVIGGAGTLAAAGLYATDAYFRHEERITHID